MMVQAAGRRIFFLDASSSRQQNMVQAAGSRDQNMDSKSTGFEFLSRRIGSLG
jgi:hypothetical protein